MITDNSASFNSSARPNAYAILRALKASAKVSSKDVVNVATTQKPAKKHWVRHALAVIVVTLLALVVWMVITSVMHKAV